MNPKGTSQYYETIVFPPTGKMDGDSDVRSIEKGDIRDALNCRWGLKNRETGGSVENIIGNKIFPVNLPVGNNKIVAGCVDYETNRGIIFLYNDQNRHCILEIDMALEEISPILWEEPVLNFDGQYVNNPVVLDGTIYWTDHNGLRNLFIESVRKYTVTNPDKLNMEGVGYWIIENEGWGVVQEGVE